MKMTQKTILIVATMLGAGMIAPVYADEVAPGATNSMNRAHPDPVANVEKRLARFKNELKITSEQERVWAMYAENTRNNVKDIRDRMEEANHEQPQTAPERFDRHIELMKKRLVSFENMDDALKQLYAALTHEQKAIADRHFAKMHH